MDWQDLFVGPAVFVDGKVGGFALQNYKCVFYITVLQVSVVLRGCAIACQ